MKITIELQDKYFTRDVLNNFQDFFNRVISDIAVSLNKDEFCLCGRYELETANLLKAAFAFADYDYSNGGSDDE